MPLTLLQLSVLITQATLTETVTASTLSGTDATLVSAAYFYYKYITVFFSGYAGIRNAYDSSI
jgi:hypothetical protein